MGIREDVQAIWAEADDVRRIAEELEQEGADFWQQQMMSERQQWERDVAATAEYESWFLEKTLAEHDAENVAEK